MGKIFCLIGKSSSGKDTIFKKILNELNMELKPVVTYTTRPKRNHEVEGKEYYFINEEKVQSYEKSGCLIEKRIYHTVDGDWIYCTVDDGQFDLKKYSYLMIGTLEVYQSLQEFFGKRAIVPLYLHIDDGVRLERALSRERQQENPNYEEVCRRFLADSADFSNAKLVRCGIDERFENHDLRECMKRMKAFILEELKSK